MSKTDGSAMNIHFVMGKIQNLHVRKYDDAECFIDLPQIDIFCTKIIDIETTQDLN